MNVLFVIAPKKEKIFKCWFWSSVSEPCILGSPQRNQTTFLSGCDDVKNSTCKSFSSCFDNEDEGGDDDGDDEGDDGDCDKARRSLCFTFE